MKTIFGTITLFFSMLAQAAPSTVIKAEDESFQVSVPSAWEIVEKKKLKEPVLISAINKEKQASLIVLGTTEHKMTCKEFLAGTDASRNTKNGLAAEKQIPSLDVLKAADAGEGALGEYEIQGKGPGFPVVQKSFCFKSKDQIRMLTGAWQKKKSAQFEPIFKDIFSSFKFLTVVKTTEKKK